LKGVGAPHTGKSDTGFYTAWWGVALILDADMKKKLINAGGGYVISHRKITFEYKGGCKDYTGSTKGTLEGWFYDPITFTGEGAYALNKDYANGQGGPRPLQNGGEAAAYFS